MQAHLPWLSQGDIFTDLPLTVVEVRTGDDTLASRQVSGPGLLITHGCVIDKRSNSGKSTNKRLHFLPLVSVAVQDPGRQAVLRNNELKPYEVLYLGNCAAFGESFVVISEVVYLPTAYFDPVLEPWTDHPNAAADDMYLTARKNSARIGRLDEEQLQMLLDKMNAFWTRQRRPGLAE